MKTNPDSLARPYAASRHISDTHPAGLGGVIPQNVTMPSQGTLPLMIPASPDALVKMLTPRYGQQQARILADDIQNKGVEVPRRGTGQLVATGFFALQTDSQGHVSAGTNATQSLTSDASLSADVQVAGGLVEAALAWLTQRQDSMPVVQDALRPGAPMSEPAIARNALHEAVAAAQPAGEFASFPGSPFQLYQPYPPAGDQPTAIAQLVEGINDGLSFQTLLGVTGSGKTFTMANVIARIGRPALVFAPNKTLAAQLYAEFREFFPKNAVEYFVSYYDYYQPEAYVPQRDLFIEKDSAINEHIEQMRLSATKSLLERRDVVIVASVSAIYGIGEPQAYHQMVMTLRVHDKLGQRDVIAQLIRMQYQRNETDFSRGKFRVRGDTIDVFPAEHSELAIRIELFDDEVESLQLFDPLTGKIRQKIPRFTVYPSSHYVTPREQVVNAIATIKEELRGRVAEFVAMGKLVEAQRIEQRTRFDLEMLQEIGHCKGIENYTRHLSGAAPGEPPSTLVDYMPADALMFLDESHVMIGQLGGMYNGDRARKTTLVEYGFRLPSALDNRPLKFEEFERKMRQAVFVSATPADYEQRTASQVVEQLVRPTGLVDPQVEVRPATHQVDDVLQEIRHRVTVHERVLITTLTKRMAEQLTDYLSDNGVKVRYLHSDVDTVERVEILRDLRLGTFDVLVGINLLREGLDIPEVSLVAILDADKEGFLRSGRSLIQTIGRAARNLNGRAILYADQMTDSMSKAIGETERRRARQVAHNLEHGITPHSVVKEVRDLIDGVYNPKGAKDDLKAAQARRRSRCSARRNSASASSSSSADAGTRAQSRVRDRRRGSATSWRCCASRRSAPTSATTFRRCRLARPEERTGLPSARRGRKRRGLSAERREPGQQFLDGLVGGDHPAVGIFAGRQHAGVELAPGDDATRRSIDQHGAQRQPHPARLDEEFVLQTDQLGVQTQLGAAAVGARSTARNAPLRSIAWAISGASICAGVSTHWW